MSFVQSAQSENLFISVLTIGELRKGAALLGRREPLGGERLRAWVDEVEMAFGSRVLPIEVDVARLWGEMSVARTRPVIDSLLAATAIDKGLTLVTRNTSDIADTGVAWIDPWQASAGQ